MKRQAIPENNDNDLSDSPFLEDEEINPQVIGNHLSQDTATIIDLFQKCSKEENMQNDFVLQIQQRLVESEKGKKTKQVKSIAEKNTKTIQKQKPGSQNPLNEDIKNFEERLASFGVDVDESQKIIPNLSQEWIKKFSNLKKKK